MSSSFFRASCAVYWLTWLMSLSYMMGISVYEKKYTIPRDDSYDASNIVKYVCILNIVLSMIGCVFVKCDISHILCVLCYSIPLFVIVPALCTYGMLKVKQIQIINEAELISITQTHWKQSKSSPSWLQRMEIDHKCCGIYSWKDYVLLGLTISDYTDPKQKPYKNDKLAPASCCRKINKKHCLKDNIVLSINDPSKDKQTPAEKESDEKNYKLTDISEFPYLDSKLKEYIYTKGCGADLAQGNQNVSSAHFIFLIILIVCSMVMLLVYIKNWCASRHFNGGSSDHSLDVENISLLDMTEEKTASNERKPLAAQKMSKSLSLSRPPTSCTAVDNKTVSRPSAQINQTIPNPKLSMKKL